MSDGLLDDGDLLDIGPISRTTDPKQAAEELRSEKGAIPARNKALGNWAERLGSGGIARDRADSPRDECHLCTANGRHVCQQCNRQACASHFWAMFGLCRECGREDGVKSWHRTGEAAAEESNWLNGSN